VVPEIAVLDIKPGKNAQFEAAMAEAATLIASIPGYVSHDV
jgi:antibiotic biosynthesis monooxygenase (ABM) superfamily enzyme